MLHGRDLRNCAKSAVTDAIPKVTPARNRIAARVETVAGSRACKRLRDQMLQAVKRIFTYSCEEETHAKKKTSGSRAERPQHVADRCDPDRRDGLDDHGCQWDIGQGTD